MADAPERHIVLGKVLLTTDRCPGVFSCRRNQLFRGRHENLHATLKPACSVLPQYHTLFKQL
jgi:hypothetical protein